MIIIMFDVYGIEYVRSLENANMRKQSRSLQLVVAKWKANRIRVA